MGQVKGFNDIIADYLKQRAEEDTLFAPKVCQSQEKRVLMCAAVRFQERLVNEELLLQ